MLLFIITAGIKCCTHLKVKIVIAMVSLEYSITTCQHFITCVNLISPEAQCGFLRFQNYQRKDVNYSIEHCLGRWNHLPSWVWFLHYFTLWLGYNWAGGENFLPKYIFKLNEFIRLFRRLGEGWGKSVSKSYHGKVVIHAHTNMVNVLVSAPELKH